MDKKQLVAGIACGFMAWGCLSAGVMMTWTCKSMILKAVKKGEN